jgi:hypothetical protein
MPTELATAFTAYRAALAALKVPADADPAASADDIEAIADHLKAVHAATLAYSRTVIAHAAERCTETLHDETDGLDDAASDVIGSLTLAARRTREGVAESRAYERRRAGLNRAIFGEDA